MTAHALPRLIPDSNVLSIPSVRSLLDPGLKSRALETAYSPAGGFVGAFSVNEDHAPPWAVRIAKYNRDEFHHDTPGRYKLLSDLPEDILPRSADLGCRCINYSHALKAWTDKQRGPKPYTEQPRERYLSHLAQGVDGRATTRIVELLRETAFQPRRGSF